MYLRVLNATKQFRKKIQTINKARPKSQYGSSMNIYPLRYSFINRMGKTTS